MAGQPATPTFPDRGVVCPVLVARSGVTLVPGMVVAIEQAQKAGITYHRQ